MNYELCKCLRGSLQFYYAEEGFSNEISSEIISQISFDKESDSSQAVNAVSNINMIPEWEVCFNCG